MSLATLSACIASDRSTPEDALTRQPSPSCTAAGPRAPSAPIAPAQSSPPTRAAQPRRSSSKKRPLPAHSSRQSDLRPRTLLLLLVPLLQSVNQVFARRAREVPVQDGGFWALQLAEHQHGQQQSLVRIYTYPAPPAPLNHGHARLASSTLTPSHPPGTHPTSFLGAVTLGVRLLMAMSNVLTVLQRECHKPGPTERRSLRLVYRCLAAPADGGALRRCTRFTATPIGRPLWQSEQAPAIHGHDWGAFWCLVSAIATSAGFQSVWGCPECKRKPPDTDAPVGWAVWWPWSESESESESEPTEALLVVSKGRCERSHKG